MVGVMKIVHGFVVAVLLALCAAAVSGERSFAVDYANDRFLKDGQPFRYVSGSMHYFRTPAAYWGDRLTKAYAAGLDAVQFYVPWNFHEVEPGKFDFSGDRDLEHFLEQVNQTGLLAIVRLGPYICGEWDFGGFPAWLLRSNQSLALRTSDPVYLAYVASWFSQLLARLKRFAYSQGGPVIMVQIENEYGSFPACDRNYLRFLYTLVRQTFGEQMVVYTTDGCGDGYLRCGTLTDPDMLALPTVDFGPGDNPAGCFAVQRKYMPGNHGPAVNSEYYTGWLDNWGHPHSRTDAAKVAASLDGILAVSPLASVNMYMFHGGTNFAFGNGANSPPFSPQPTSYDYDAPLSEAGDTTWKYWLVRSVIGKYKPLPNITVPANSTKAAYGRVAMSRVVTLPEYIASGPSWVVRSVYPMSFEQLGLSGGFLLYSWSAASESSYPSGTLDLSGVHDRGYAFDSSWSLLGTVYRDGSAGMKLHVPALKGLFLLVEAFGHVNYGSQILGDRKGLVLNVTLTSDNADKLTLTNWTMYPICLHNITQRLTQILNRRDRSSRLQFSMQRNLVMHASLDDDRLRFPTDANSFVPTFYTNAAQSFVIKGEAHDTFARIDGGWSKGQLLVNGANLGRYWPSAGPQVTLYVPAVALRANSSGVANSVWLFELERSPCSSLHSSRQLIKPLRVPVEGESEDSCSIEFVDTPILDGPTLLDTPVSLRNGMH